MADCVFSTADGDGVVVVCVTHGAPRSASVPSVCTTLALRMPSPIKHRPRKEADRG